MNVLMRWSCIFIFSILHFKCKNVSDVEGNTNSVKAQTSKSNIEVFEHPIQKFSLPYDTSFILDSNNLIFSKQVPFDTSYVIHLLSGKTGLLGVCYLILPSYHRDFEDYYDETSRLVFFDGFSFKLNEKDWNELKVQTREIMRTIPDTTDKPSPCFDCKSYSLFYDKRKINSMNGAMRKKFTSYDSFIYNKIIARFNSKRVHRF
jgi:hypothetical protein